MREINFFLIWTVLMLNNLCKQIPASFYHSFPPNWVSRRKEDHYWSRWRSAPSERSCQFSCLCGRRADPPSLMLPATPCSSARYGSRSIIFYEMVWRCPLSASVPTNFRRNFRKQALRAKNFHKHYTNDLYFRLHNIFRYLNINRNKSLDTLDSHVISFRLLTTLAAEKKEKGI